MIAKHRQDFGILPVHVLPGINCAAAEVELRYAEV